MPKIWAIHFSFPEWEADVWRPFSSMEGTLWLSVSLGSWVCISDFDLGRIVGSFALPLVSTGHKAPQTTNKIGKSRPILLLNYLLCPEYKSKNCTNTVVIVLLKMLSNCCSFTVLLKLLFNCCSLSNLLVAPSVNLENL